METMTRREGSLGERISVIANSLVSMVDFHDDCLKNGLSVYSIRQIPEEVLSEEDIELYSVCVDGGRIS